jgi:hypothetical protein
MTETKLKPVPARRTSEELPDDAEFRNLTDLMDVGTAAANQLATIEAEVNESMQELIDEFRKDYAAAQSALAKAEAAMEIACRANPGWFAKAKSIKTPWGKVAFRSGASLLVKDEEATVRLIEAIHKPDAEQYLRTVKLPNLEALEALPDEELKRVMVKRLVKDSFSFTPAKIDMGTAVASAEGN